jgi:hypothetical protein
MMDQAASGTLWPSSKPLTSFVRCLGLVETAYGSTLTSQFFGPLVLAHKNTAQVAVFF